MISSNTFRNALDFNLEAAEEIDYICKPFFKRFSLIYFAYLKIVNDGSILRLSNHKQWTKNYFDKKLYNETNFYSNHWQQVTLEGSKRFLWVSQPDTKMLSEWYNNGIGNGLSIYNRKNNILETYSFGTYLENYEANSLYIKYGTEYDKFVSYFKMKAFHLLSFKGRSHLITPNKKLLLQKSKETGLSQLNIDSYLNSLNNS